MNIPLLDLKAQYATLKPEIERAIQSVVDSQMFILGSEVKAMEEELSLFLHVKCALGVSSGTDALLIALMANNIRPGDEIIVPTYSFFATAGVVSRLNAVPVFVDIDPVSFNMDPSRIESRISPKTRAIIPVHLYGQSADMDRIMEIAHRHNLVVIEDAAQAIGARTYHGTSVGTIGDIGCFSFFPSKNLGCFGDGGLVVTHDDELSERLRILRVHGGKPKYYHKIIGGNFRLDALQAAIVRAKLPHLDGWSKARYANAERYTSLCIKCGLAEGAGHTTYNDRNRVLLPKVIHEDSTHPYQHIYNQYVIRTEHRDDLRAHLKQRGIATEIYYPVPFHRQVCFQNVVRPNESFPVAEMCAAQSLALPIYPELTEEQLAYVVTSIAEFLGG